jgi:hypothetical protein
MRLEGFAGFLFFRRLGLGVRGRGRGALRALRVSGFGFRVGEEKI